jgi:hypothetical protein
MSTNICRGIYHNSLNFYSVSSAHKQHQADYRTAEDGNYVKAFLLFRTTVDFAGCFRALHYRGPLICGNVLMYYNWKKNPSVNEFSTGFLGRETWYLADIFKNLNVLYTFFFKEKAFMRFQLQKMSKI